MLGKYDSFSIAENAFGSVENAIAEFKKEFKMYNVPYELKISGLFQKHANIIAKSPAEACNLLNQRLKENNPLDDLNNELLTQPDDELTDFDEGDDAVNIADPSQLAEGEEL